jgi:Sulfotransferase domain
MNYPNFIIIGAMKSGTTTLHHILAKQEEIFIPKPELFFFDIDDHFQHPDFFKWDRRKWFYQDYVKNYDINLKWYKSFFTGCNGKIIGEDSTSYLASKEAAERIFAFNPQVKLIIMLRDPVKRAYSHYWHALYSGRITSSFEKVIRFNQGTILQRGFYKEQIERYYLFFKKENIKIIIFEDFIKNIPQYLIGLKEFLKASKGFTNKIDQQHYNKTPVPRSLLLVYVYNKIFGNKIVAKKYFYSHFENERGSLNDLVFNFHRVMKHSLFSRKKKYPPMHIETKNFLENYYNRVNSGLSELINTDLSNYWTYFSKN